MIETLEQTSFPFRGETINRSVLLHKTVKLIDELAALYYELQPSDLQSKRRTARIAHARQMAMALIREHTRLSLMEIGDLFSRDHGTVIHAIKAVNGRCKTDAEFQAAYERCSSQVRKWKNA